MEKLAASDRLTELSTQLVGMSEIFRILSENDHEVRHELFDFLSYSAERIGEECEAIAERITSREGA